MGNTYRRAVTETSTVLTEVGGVIGERRKDDDGKEYLLMYAAGTIAEGVPIAANSTSDFYGEACIAADGVVAVNCTTQSLSAGEYFWGLTAGLGPVKFGATIAASAPVVAASALGVKQVGTNVEHVFAVVADTRSGAGTTNCYIKALG